MTDEAKPNRANPDVPAGPQSSMHPLMLLPGLVAIGLYMFLLAGVTVLGVVGGHYHPLFLAFAVFFVMSGLGLLLLLRWAWAMALAAVTLLAGVFLWQFATQHVIAYIVQGLLNLVFFLYLVRTEVRDRLR